MNVKVAAQTLSSSVADTIEFLMKNDHPLFQGAEATIYFMLTVNPRINAHVKTRPGRLFEDLR